MSLRDFLLDYAEKAPFEELWDEAEAGVCIRFASDEQCPLELAFECAPAHQFETLMDACDDQTYRASATYYGFGDDEELIRLIIDAADGRCGSVPAVRAWRAILEKLAESETR